MLATPDTAGIGVTDGRRGTSTLAAGGKLVDLKWLSNGVGENVSCETRGPIQGGENWLLDELELGGNVPKSGIGSGANDGGL